MIQQEVALSAEARQQIIQTLLEIERSITENARLTERSKSDFPFGRRNGYRQALTEWLGPDTVKELSDEAWRLHVTETRNEKQVAS